MQYKTENVTVSEKSRDYNSHCVSNVVVERREIVEDPYDNIDDKISFCLETQEFKSK